MHCAMPTIEIRANANSDPFITATLLLWPPNIALDIGYGFNFKKCKKKLLNSLGFCFKASSLLDNSIGTNIASRFSFTLIDVELKFASTDRSSCGGG